MLREATEQQSGELAGEFTESAQAFYGAADLLERFEPGEKRLLRRLAYFSRFDDYALRNHFGGEAHLVRDLIERSADLFEDGRFTRSIRRDAAGRLQRYNRHAEAARYQQQLDALQKLWQERVDMLEAERRTKEGELLDLEGKLRDSHSELQLQGDLQKRASLGMNELDAELHVA